MGVDPLTMFMFKTRNKKKESQPSTTYPKIGARLMQPSAPDTDLFRYM